MRKCNGCVLCCLGVSKNGLSPPSQLLAASYFAQFSHMSAIITETTRIIHVLVVLLHHSSLYVLVGRRPSIWKVFLSDRQALNFEC
jgi:hypothetical protein